MKRKPILLIHILFCLTLTACSDEDEAPGGPIWISTGGDLNLRLSSTPEVKLERVTFQLQLGGTWITSRQLGPPTLITDMGGKGIHVVRFGRGASAGPERVDLTITDPGAGGGAWTLSFEVTAPAGNDLKLQALEVNIPKGGLALPGLGGSLYFLQDGYQSWSFTGAVEIKAGTKSRAVTDPKKVFLAGTGDPSNELQGVGWWFGLLAPSQQGPYLAVGATSSERRRFALLPSLPASGAAALDLRLGTAGESVTIKAGAAHKLESIALATSARAHAALDAYVEAVAAANKPAGGAKSLRQETVQDPTGWWSWNIFFDKVTEKDMLTHADLLKSSGLDKKGFTFVELDDGYETRWGDWELTKTTFPSGLAGLAKAITGKGLKIGVWLAPFLVHQDSKLVTDHPDWFVKDSDGKKLLTHTQMGVAGTMYVLDPTVAGAASHLSGLFSRLAKAGYTLFKLDFLYAGALPGKRSADVTGVEAMRLGLDLMRKAAPGTHINLCGMPFLPAVGRGHSVRFGTDIAFGGVKLGPVQIAHEARNVMLRGFFDRVIRNDPDQALLRAPLSLDEARVQATFVAMTGFYSSGDDLTKLSTERLALLQDDNLLAMAKLGRSAVALDPLSATGDQFISPIMDPGLGVNDARTALPSLFYLDGKGAGPSYLAVFNWTKQKATPTVDLGLAEYKGTKVTELWTKKSVTVTGSKITAELGPFSVALLKLE